MGKTANKKRNKKLKDAKREREQNALIAAGLGPAAKAVQQRATRKGSQIIFNNSKIKYSELLKEFVHPLVQMNDDISIIRTKYTFGAHAWNMAILKEKSEELFQKAKMEISTMMPDVPEVEQLFDEMVKRKQEEFSEYKNIISDFEINKIRGMIMI